MTTSPPAPPGDTARESSHGNRLVFIAIGIAVVILMIGGFIAYRSAKETETANQKADQLIAALTAAGAPAPSKTQIVRILGDDGGPVCEDPNNALKQAMALSALTNGAAGPGIRPVIADRDVLRGELAVLAIYCPEELPEFQEFVDNLKSANVIKE
jgi:hypothetical protein